MASADFKAYLESRLQVLVPGIDLDPGSPAQTDFIEPIVARLGADPFDTDIQAFLEDRFSQEFPDLYAAEPGVLRDLFINPLRSILEPFKREIATISRNQSLSDPTVLSDQDADSLLANWFQDRDVGSPATGTVRIFFASPTTVNIQANRASTAGGLGFVPAAAVLVSSQEMAFNRLGSLYYVDVNYVAEAVGDEYNVAAEEIVSVDGLYGVVRVSNPRPFSNGSAKEANETLVSKVLSGLSERSMVTQRGAYARSLEAFQGSIDSVQVVGAGDEEMERDLLVAEGPGHAWVMGSVTLYGNLALVRARIVDGELVAPKAGELVFCYLPTATFPGLTQAARFIRRRIVNVLVGPASLSVAGYQTSFLVTVEDLPSGSPSIPNGTYEGGILRAPFVKISSLPSGAAYPAEVGSGEVHVYGHSDIYVRPSSITEANSVVRGVSDSAPILERSSLYTTGTTSGQKNKVTDAAAGFTANGVRKGDYLEILQGQDAGVYAIREVSSADLYLDQNLTAAAGPLTYRVYRSASIDPFNPKVMKFPFAGSVGGDLQTAIGTDLFRFSTNDLISFGAQAGDVINVLSGPDLGEFVIKGFDSALGGRGVIVDRPATATTGNLSYEVYTKQDPVQLPLVRYKKIELLDSGDQPTGIVVPPADPVGVLTVCSMTGARVRGESVRATGWVVPDLSKFIPNPTVSVAASSGDQRYSLNFEEASGIYRSFIRSNSTQAEVDLVPSLFGRCSWFFVAAEGQELEENFPRIDPKPGDCLTLATGPNKGDYLIRRVLKFQNKFPSLTRPSDDTQWFYLIEIYGQFPVDVLGDVRDFLVDRGVSISDLQFTSSLSWSSIQTAYEGIGAKLSQALSGIGATVTAADCQSALNQVFLSAYSWGDPARGSVRSYFTDPVLFTQRTATSDDVTVYEHTTEDGSLLRFRPDPLLYVERQVFPPTAGDLSGTGDLPRDATLSYGSPISSLQVSLADLQYPSALNAGIRAGDEWQVHSQVFLSQDGAQEFYFARTVTGSNRLTLPASADGLFHPSHLGAILFLEEGKDKGAYRITKWVDSRTVEVDKAMTTTSPSIILQGAAHGWGNPGSSNRVIATSSVFTSDHVGKWITLYGNVGEYRGSYRISEVVTGTSVVVERAGNGTDFPTQTTGVSRVYWILTDAPTTEPEIVGNGTEFLAGSRIRLYEAIPIKYPVAAVTYTDPTVSQFQVTGTLAPTGANCPYRVVRKDERSITPTTMSASTEGALYYFDTQLVSLSPLPKSNLEEGVHLVPKPGTFESQGYRHVASDRTLTYSTKEEGLLVLPASVLPSGVAQSPSNEVPVVNASLGITYERAPVLTEFQLFLDSGEDRVTVANMLARHALPAYVSYDASYSGGSATDVVAADIIAYIRSIPAESPVDISKLEEQIIRRGGNPDTPTEVVLLIHDWSRRVWMEKGKNEVGGRSVTVPYDGTVRVTQFFAGKDVSSLRVIPAGERIKLTRR